MPQITINLERAISELQAGKPVAIPTETVYGLAAMVNKPRAIKAIFEMKNRPLNHPLIVHIAPEWDLSDLVQDLPDYAKQLIKAFWPGALTLVAPCKLNQSYPLITGGQTTMALRAPAHPTALKLLRKLNTPLVAPSANPFGKISPTTALHVKESFPDEELLILDGGRCSIGIESTIIDVTQPDTYRILRAGLINEEAIAQIVETAHQNRELAIRVPGNLESHYQPQKNLYYFESSEELASFCDKRQDNIAVIARNKPEKVQKQLYYPLGDSPAEAAFNLYYQLRQADASDSLCIVIELPAADNAWQGIRERILKAGFPYSKPKTH